MINWFKLVMSSIFTGHYNTIFGSIEEGCVINEFRNRVIMRLFTLERLERNHLGAKTWLCYIEICVMVRGVIMRL